MTDQAPAPETTPTDTATTTEVATPQETTSSTPATETTPTQETPSTPTSETILDTGADKSWLPEEYRDNQNLSKFASLDELAKSHLNLVSKIGEKGIIKPGEDATPEQWNDYYNQLGRPTEASAYELSEMNEEVANMFGFDDTITDAFKESIHKRGLTSEQAQGVWEDMGGLLGSSAETITQGDVATKESGMTALQEKWGGDVDANVQKAQSALEQLGLQDVAVKYNLANEAGFIEKLAQVANILKPDNGSSAAMNSGEQVPSKSNDLESAIKARNEAIASNNPTALKNAKEQIAKFIGQ